MQVLHFRQFKIFLKKFEHHHRPCYYLLPDLPKSVCFDTPRRKIYSFSQSFVCIFQYFMPVLHFMLFKVLKNFGHRQPTCYYLSNFQ